MKGRPPNVQPTLAFERRRYLTLVQVLAIDEHGDAICELCERWGVEPVRLKSPMAAIDTLATIRKLAQHVVEYHREQE
jgi:hypothetical protein